MMPRIILKLGILFIFNFIGILNSEERISDIASSSAFLERWVPNFSREKVITW